jgi:hypothetical protein
MMMLGLSIGLTLKCRKRWQEPLPCVMGWNVRTLEWVRRCQEQFPVTLSLEKPTALFRAGGEHGGWNHFLAKLLDRQWAIECKGGNRHSARNPKACYTDRRPEFRILCESA